MTPEYILRKSLCRPAHCLGEYEQKHGGQLAFAESEIESMRFAQGYAEPGYTDPSKGILFANWNYFPRGVDTILERYGFAIEWSDEWSECENCNKAIRTSGNSYSWQPSFGMVDDCTILCADCLKGEAESYLESLENNPSTALNISSIDPADYGYVKVEGDFQNGLHEGMNDNPKKIYTRLHERYSRLLFQIDEQSQFYIGFAVWSHPEETD
jgi:hypothetical protein